jgi:dUTP pyrophosphatase
MKIFRCKPLAKIPEYQTPGSAGMDLHACFNDEMHQEEIPIGQSLIVYTGLKIEIPRGMEGQIRSRSGLAAKYGIHVLNSPGTIDSDYRGEIAVILHRSGPGSLGENTAVIRHGDRIAQLVISDYVKMYLNEVSSESELVTTVRGTGGLGSTGT